MTNSTTVSTRCQRSHYQVSINSSESGVVKTTAGLSRCQRGGGNWCFYWEPSAEQLLRVRLTHTWRFHPCWSFWGLSLFSSQAIQASALGSGSRGHPHTNLMNHILRIQAFPFNMSGWQQKKGRVGGCGGHTKCSGNQSKIASYSHTFSSFARCT